MSILSNRINALSISATSAMGKVTGAAFGNNQCIRFSFSTSTDLRIEAEKRTKKTLALLK